MKILKPLLATATSLVIVMGSAVASAQVPPMPECVDNPACQQPKTGCSISGVTPGATVPGVIALGVVAAALVRRRSKKR